MTALFQQLPSVDKFLKTPEGEMLLTEFGHSAVVRELRQLLSEGREFIKQHQNLPQQQGVSDKRTCRFPPGLKKSHCVQRRADVSPPVPY